MGMFRVWFESKRHFLVNSQVLRDNKRITPFVCVVRECSYSTKSSESLVNHFILIKWHLWIYIFLHVSSKILLNRDGDQHPDSPKLWQAEGRRGHPERMWTILIISDILMYKSVAVWHPNLDKNLSTFYQLLAEAQKPGNWKRVDVLDRVIFNIKIAFTLRMPGWTVAMIAP